MKTKQLNLFNKQRAAHNEHLFIDLVNQGYLEIDSEGIIWRIAKKHKFKSFSPIKRKRAEQKDKKGYLYVNVGNNGKTINCKAHRVVWTFFNGEIPDNLEINHKNGIKTDNRLVNLELVTVSENQKHAFRIGLQSIKGENHPSSKLTEDDVREIRERYKNGETKTSIAKDYNISRTQVSNIVNRKKWAHVL